MEVFKINAKMKKYELSILLILFLLKIIPAQNLSLSINLEKNRFLIGESIIAIVSIANSSNQPKIIPFFNYLLNNDNLTISLKDENGNILNPLRWFEKYEASKATDFVLNLNEGVSNYINLSFIYGDSTLIKQDFQKFFWDPVTTGFLNIGEYTIEAKYKNIDTGEEILSNKISFTVTNNFSDEDLIIYDQIISLSSTINKLNKKDYIREIETLIRDNKMVNSPYLINLYATLLSYYFDLSGDSLFREKFINLVRETILRFPDSYFLYGYLLNHIFQNSDLFSDKQFVSIIEKHKAFDTFKHFFRIINLKIN